MREELKKPLLNVIRIVGITIAVYLGIRFLLPLGIPFVIAFFLAKKLHPLIEKLHKKIKIKSGIITAITLLLLLAVVALVLWVLGKNLVQQLQNLFVNVPMYQEKMIVIWEDYCVQLEKFTGIQADVWNLKVIETMPQVWEQMKGTIIPAVMNSSLLWVKAIGALLAASIVIVVSTLIILKEYDNLRQGMKKNALGQAVLRILVQVYQAGGSYIKAQIVILVTVSAVCVVGLFLTGNSYALLAGVGIGLCDALPFLGTGTVFIPWAILEIVRGRYMMAAIYAIIYTFTNITRELLEPKLVGDKLGISPLMVVVSVYIGVCIYGFWGFALGPFSYILIREIWKEIY